MGIHEAKLHRQRVDIAKFTSLIREARIITGFSYPRLHDDRTPLIRKVSGRPARQAAGRTVSALKARTASMRTVRVAKAPSAPLTVEHPVVERAAPPLVPTGPVVAEERVKSREPAPPGPLRAKPDMSRLTRKSSARLKRLGSAGSVLIRRLSKVSITEDACSASSGDMPTSSTFDPDTLKRLKVNPKEVITEYIAELNRVENEAEEDVIKLNSAQKLLNDRRVIHCKVMDVLDHFYGSLPGWQEDPISQRMFPETVDMTEAGLQAERDLVEARTLRQRVYAACDDHSHGLKALSHIATNLNRFIRHFEQLVSCLGEYESVVQSDPISKRSNVDITAALLDLEKLLEGCVTSANIATACCVDAPRVSHLQSELKNLRDGFARESIAVMTQGRIYRSDLDGTVQVAKTGLSDCRLAEAFVAERKKMIIADLPTFENQVERCEEYVMHERIGILDIHHSIS